MSPAHAERRLIVRSCGGTHESSRHRRRSGRPLFRDPDEEGVAADAASPCSSATGRTTRSASASCSPTRRWTRFEAYDRESYRAIIGHFAYWDDIEIHFRGTTHRIGGNGFCGCSRIDAAARFCGRRARSLGVDMKFQTEISPLDPRDPRRRPGGRGRRHQFAHARDLRRQVQAEHRSAAELLLLDGLDAAVRRLHVLLPRDRARHLHRALLSVPAGALDLDHRDRSGDLRARRARQARRERVGALPRRRVRRGARRPQADHQPLALAQFPDHPLRALDRTTTSC